MSRNLGLCSRVRQIATPGKISKLRLDRAQRINKVTKCLFGPVVRKEFQSVAKVELAKYQRQASNKWGFDFTLDKPIKSNKEFEWETIPVKEMPKIYHVINANTRIHHHPSVFEANRANHLDIEYFSGLQNENICPLVDIKKPILVRRKSLGKRNHQTKITDFLKEKKRRISTSSTSFKKSQ